MVTWYQVVDDVDYVDLNNFDQLVSLSQQRSTSICWSSCMLSWWWGWWWRCCCYGNDDVDKKLDWLGIFWRLSQSYMLLWVFNLTETISWVRIFKLSKWIWIWMGGGSKSWGWVFSLADPDPDRDSSSGCRSRSWYAHEPSSSTTVFYRAGRGIFRSE